ncbi:MAG TPA: ABC transporter permease, partial [Clostridia bacterium]|nr:ABC transporter permease [Clostridia bacterium]
MGNYIVRRILSILPVLLVVSLVIFSIVHLTPGDPASAMLGDQATQEDVEALRVKMGINDPLVVQYGRWIGNVLRGNFGKSVANNQPVSAMLRNCAKPTVSLTIYAMIISLLMALPLGMAAAKRKNTVVDHAISSVSLLGISMPSFLLGLLLMMLFAVKLRWLPVSGFKDLSQGLGAHVRSLTLPAIALGFMHATFMTRMTRAAMLDVLMSDYIKMARAKGVREAWITSRHALRNALISIITVTGQSLIGMLSGAAVVESLFGIPGIGQLMVNSIGRRDYNVIQAIVLVVASLNVLINLAVDMIYGVIDPRV